MSVSSWCCAVIGIASALATSVANAAPLAIVNPGFETDMAPVVGATGWTITSGGTDWFTTTAGAPNSPGDPSVAFEGVNWLSGNRLATGAASSSNPQIITQLVDISADAALIDAGTAGLALDFTYSDADGNDDGSVQVNFFSDVAGTTPIGSGLTTGVLAELPGYTPGNLTGAVPVGARSLEIELRIDRSFGSAGNVHFDAFSGAIARVPEPATIVLLGLGAMGIAWGRKRS